MSNNDAVEDTSTAAVNVLSLLLHYALIIGRTTTSHTRAVFKGRGELLVQTLPRNVEKKNFFNVKKHVQRNVSADALCLH